MKLSVFLYMYVYEVAVVRALYQSVSFPDRGVCFLCLTLKVKKERPEREQLFIL